MRYARKSFASSENGKFFATLMTCHEMGHYLIHQLFVNEKGSFDPTNFTEAFSEGLAYDLEFGQDFQDMENRSKYRGFRQAEFDFSRGHIYSCFYHPHNRYSKRKANRFVKMRRLLPYEWFKTLQESGERTALLTMVEEMRMKSNTETNSCFGHGMGIYLLEVNFLRRMQRRLVNNYDINFRSIEMIMVAKQKYG